jgi:hypothetical protein
VLLASIATHGILAVDDSKSWKFDVSTKSEAYLKAKSSGVGFNADGSEVSNRLHPR